VEFTDGYAANLLFFLFGIENALTTTHIEQKISSGKSSRWNTLLIKNASSNFTILGENGCA
jgi:hypothetical protein